MPPLEDASTVAMETPQVEDGTEDGFTYEDDLEAKNSGLLVTISKKERDRMGIPLKRTLIVKLLGKSVGFNFLEKRLNQWWARKGVITIVDLDNEYYLVKFSTDDDFNFALFEGPWLIFDHYLSLRPWFTKFDPSTDVIRSIAAWVRFPKLPFDCFDKKFLWSFGNRNGKSIKIDNTTSLQSRGKFARVCIEIDISKPLI